MERRKDGRKEGRKDGRTDGRTEGRKGGRKEGRKEGRKDGRTEGRKEGLAVLAMARRWRESRTGRVGSRWRGVDCGGDERERARGGAPACEMGSWLG